MASENPFQQAIMAGIGDDSFANAYRAKAQQKAAEMQAQAHSALEAQKETAARDRIAGNLASAEGLAQRQGLKPGKYSVSANEGGLSVSPRDDDALANLLRAKQLAKPELTPGQEAADKTFGKDYSDYVAGGGSAGVSKSLGQLERAAADIPNGNMLERAAGILPDRLRDFLTPAARAREDAIKGSIQGTLRQTLGAAFTEAEGRAVMERAYNPRLSNEENMARVQAITTELKQGAAQKEQSSKQFEKTGSLVGLEAATKGGPAMPTLQGEAAVDPQMQRYLELKKKHGR